jgi:hypothetical protein
MDKTLKGWMEGVKRYDFEDLTGFIDAIEKLLNWNDFYECYGKDMRVLKTILEIERVSQGMEKEKNHATN